MMQHIMWMLIVLFQAIAVAIAVSASIWMHVLRELNISVSIPLSFENNCTERAYPLYRTVVRLK